MAKSQLGKKQLLSMPSSHPWDSRIAFQGYIDGLAWMQLHPDGLELKHRSVCGVPRLLAALGPRLELVFGISLLNPFLLFQLVLWTEVIIHPEQLLDSTSLIGQLEVVVMRL